MLYMLVRDIVVNSAFKPAHIVHSHYPRKLVSRTEAVRDIPGGRKTFRSEPKRFLVVEYGSVEYLRFHKILEDMTPVGKLRVVARSGLLQLANHLERADIRECGWHPELRRGRPDSPRNYQHHVHILIAVLPVYLTDKRGDRVLFVVRHLVVRHGIDVNDNVEL